MKKTFEINKRYTLTHLFDYSNYRQPARFIEGTCRDIHCEQLAWECINQKETNDDTALVILDEKENCMGYHLFSQVLFDKEDGILYYSNISEVLEYVLISNAKKVLIVSSNYSCWSIKLIDPLNDFIPELAKILDAMNVEFIEYREVKKDRSYRIRKGNE